MGISPVNESDIEPHDEGDHEGHGWTPAEKAALTEGCRGGRAQSRNLIERWAAGAWQEHVSTSTKADIRRRPQSDGGGQRVKEMRTRGKVSAVDCLNSLIWLKLHNCYWTRTPEDRYGNREHRRKLIERWARESWFDRLADWYKLRPCRRAARRNSWPSAMHRPAVVVD